jgi:predicted house-cleaning noncanonical NTP pyrophosphatase (MazG superfamily)
MSEKLVRDRIPEIIKKNGDTAIIRVADNDGEYLELLKRKLIEEAREFADGAKPEELADVLEVMRALCELSGLTMGQIEQLADNKKAERGGFEQRYVLTLSK